MIVAIHQPNFLPWLGYFDKLLRSDVFVLFDDVQFPRARSFANRASIKTPNGEARVTVPVKSKGTIRNIGEVEIADPNWQKKPLRTLEHAYSRAPYFEPYFGPLRELLFAEKHDLCRLNCSLIRFVSDALGGTPRFVFSSELCLGTTLSGQEKILHILRTLDADTYISGTGAGSQRYITEDAFRDAGIKLEWQHFRHPVYPQLHGQFVPGLSAVDFLFNCGPAGRATLLDSEAS